MAVADKIGDDNPDIKQDMYEACKEARTAGECALVRRVGKLGFSLWLPMLLKVSGPYEACPQGSRRGLFMIRSYIIAQDEDKGSSNYD